MWIHSQSNIRWVNTHFPVNNERAFTCYATCVLITHDMVYSHRSQGSNLFRNESGWFIWQMKAAAFIQLPAEYLFVHFQSKLLRNCLRWATVPASVNPNQKSKKLWPNTNAKNKLGLALAGLGKYNEGQLMRALQETKRRLSQVSSQGLRIRPKWMETYDITEKNNGQPLSSLLLTWSFIPSSIQSLSEISSPWHLFIPIYFSDTFRGTNKAGL